MLDERQKKIIMDFRDNKGDLQELPGFKQADLKNREFTLKITEIFPFACEDFDCELFTKPYVDELLKKAAVFFNRIALSGGFANLAEYKDDWNIFSAMVEVQVKGKMLIDEKVKKTKNKVKRNLNAQKGEQSERKR